MQDRWLEYLGSIRTKVHGIKKTTLARDDIERIFNVKKESARQLIHLIQSVSGHTEKTDKRLSVPTDVVKSFLTRFPTMPNNASRDDRKVSIKAAREMLKSMKSSERSVAELTEPSDAGTESPSELPSNTELTVPLGTDLVAAIAEAARRKGQSPDKYAASILYEHVKKLGTKLRQKGNEVPATSTNSTTFGD